MFLAFRKNEQFTIQQGLFLCPSDLNAGFEKNLLAFVANDFSDYALIHQKA
jgi:hypothetical protein